MDQVNSRSSTTFLNAIGIISGLCQGVMVVEAKLRSGSLITCERAMEEGRDVFAIPGNILDGKSDGCHHLIQEGAKCITTGFDILSEFFLKIKVLL